MLGFNGIATVVHDKAIFKAHHDDWQGQVRLQIRKDVLLCHPINMGCWEYEDLLKFLLKYPQSWLLALPCSGQPAMGNGLLACYDSLTKEASVIEMKHPPLTFQDYTTMKPTGA